MILYVNEVRQNIVILKGPNMKPSHWTVDTKKASPQLFLILLSQNSKRIIHGKDIQDTWYTMIT